MNTERAWHVQKLQAWFHNWITDKEKGEAEIPLFT